MNPEPMPTVRPSGSGRVAIFNPGDPAIDAMRSRFVDAATDSNNRVVLVCADAAHTVAASELATIVRVVNVRALADQHARVPVVA